MFFLKDQLDTIYSFYIIVLIYILFILNFFIKLILIIFLNQIEYLIMILDYILFLYFDL